MFIIPIYREKKISFDIYTYNCTYNDFENKKKPKQVLAI